MHRVLTFPHCFRANTEVSQKCGLEATTLLLWQNLERCCHCLFCVRIFTQHSGSSLRAQQLQPAGSGGGEMLWRPFWCLLVCRGWPSTCRWSLGTWAVTPGEALLLGSTMPLAKYETVVGGLNLNWIFQEKDGRVLALGRSEYGRLGLGEGDNIWGNFFKISFLQIYGGNSLRGPLQNLS